MVLFEDLNHLVKKPRPEPAQTELLWGPEATSNRKHEGHDGLPDLSRNYPETK